MKPLLILTSALLITSAFTAEPEIPNDEFFKVETLATDLADAMEIAVAPNGQVFIAERTGALKCYYPDSNETKVIRKFDVSVRHKKGNKTVSRETGLLGVTLDPNFDSNGWIYLYYSPKSPSEHRLVRMTLKNNKLTNEKVLLNVPQSREDEVCHEGGSLAFDNEGNLFLSTGDNSDPFSAKGYAPLDERKGHEHINSQRSAGSTNDLRGKILRITPTEDGSYTIPEGNLFGLNQPDTRPEIFVMGCRNPWRIGVDQHTGTVYWGDVGPDAREANKRGPAGLCEINQAREAGNYGWPYFLGDNQPYRQFNFETGKAGSKFIANRPHNRSRLNTGLEYLPPAQHPLWSVRRSCYCAATVYYYDDYPTSESKLPKELNRCLITYDWNNGQMQLTKLDSNEKMEWKADWLHTKKLIHPGDVEIGADGSMYVLEYSSKWYGGTDGKLKRVTFTNERQTTEGIKEDPRLAGLDAKHPGYKLLSEAICLSCHQTQVTSIGPSYVDVAAKYRGDNNATEYLVEKISKGGGGVWGEIPMPPHPQYNEEQISQMVDAIMSLAPEEHKK